MFAFSVQRASFFAAADENHRPVSAASSSDQAEDQLTAQIKPYTGYVNAPDMQASSAINQGKK